MKSKLLFSVSIVLCMCLFVGGNIFAKEADSNFGHITYVDQAATVIRQDKTEHAAIVNLPVAPGDQVVTGANGRCELQFDNGTVLRLDKNTKLTVTTILAPTFTSNKKITTLNLEQGQIYSMIQSYNKEIFQIMTTNAAIEFKQRTAATIRLTNNGETLIFTDKGKCQVMFGDSVKTLKTETAYKGKNCFVSSTNKFDLSQEKRDSDFTIWNDYVNDHYRKLHYGISVVPKKLNRYPKALTYWAEKWSTSYGQWKYDDIFGYVWIPADETFAFSQRPFFHASFYRINGQLSVVPQEPWGWLPAHLGTWIWMKWGWTWVPSNVFSSSVGYVDSFFNFFTLDHWIYSIYGNYDLYYEYRHGGLRSWRQSYRNTYQKEPPKIDLKRVPESVRTIIKAMNDAPVDTIKDRLGVKRPNTIITGPEATRLLESKEGLPSINQKSLLQAATTEATRNRKSVITLAPIDSRGENPQPHAGKSTEAMMKAMAIRTTMARDFNPDTKWAIYRGYSVHYSSKLNAVVCPNLGIDSKNLTRNERSAYFGFNSNGGPYGNGNSNVRTLHSTDGVNGNLNNGVSHFTMPNNSTASKHDPQIEHKEGNK